MPWNIVDLVSKRLEFLRLVEQGSLPLAELCRRYQISRKTAYKWLHRVEQVRLQGLADECGLRDASRKPHSSPARVPDAVEEAVIALRLRYPYWGSRKLRALLPQTCPAVAGSLPSASTINAILKRHGLISVEASQQATPFTRFEHPHPNDLWQMDHKGHHQLIDRSLVYPLTVLDDHSRFNLVLNASANEQGQTVQQALIHCFRRYGLPQRMTMDNGSPWGNDPSTPYTALTFWLMRLGIRISHSRPYHPQTQGKDERFHHTLDVEIFRYRPIYDLVECQRVFDQWREQYNNYRPHEAVGQKPPASRYLPSTRTYPETLPPIEYGPDDIVRKVQSKGRFSFAGRECRTSKGLRGYPIALRPTLVDGIWEVYFCATKLGQLSLHDTAAVPAVK